jgi:hypothetical protein
MDGLDRQSITLDIKESRESRGQGNSKGIKVNQEKRKGLCERLDRRPYLAVAVRRIKIKN